MYLQIENDLHWPNPVVSSATAKPAAVIFAFSTARWKITDAHWRLNGNMRVFGASVDVNDVHNRAVFALSRSSDRLPFFFALMVRKSRWTCARVRDRHSEMRRPCS
jgi:hypothetical protein